MKSPWPELIQLPKKGGVAVGRSSESDVVVKHRTISRQHFKIIWQEDGILLEDTGSRYGVYVNGTRIKSYLIKQGDIVCFGNSPRYQLKMDQLVIAKDGLDIHLENVGIKRSGQVLLENVSLFIRPGTFVGVLGPSGAGKSLTVGIFSSTIIPDMGGVSFNGKPLEANVDEFRGKMGLVLQEDLVHGALTVGENLLFSGRLKLPQLSADELQDRIDQTLDEVNLVRDKNKLVKDLSGGQRKRVSVAIEIMMRPQLIILDEPTSGLDPAAAAKLMDVLRGLARKGITIICTTHTLDTMNYFDALMVLRKSHDDRQKGSIGKLAYYGEPGKILKSFSVRNTADLFEKLTANGKSNPDTEEAVITTPMPDDSESESEQSLLIHDYRPWVSGLGETSRQTDFITQIQVIITRSLLPLWRDNWALLSNFAQPLLLGLLIPLAMKNATSSLSIHFFLVISALWIGATMTVREIVNERKLYVRDRLVSLSPNAFLCGKLIQAALVLLPVSFLLFGAAHFSFPLFIEEGHKFQFPASSVGLEGEMKGALDLLEGISLFKGWLILWMSAVGGALIGLMISVVSKTERTAVQILPLVVLPQILLSRLTVETGQYGWMKSGLPFSPLKLDPQLDAVALFSLPLISRPATAVMDMQLYHAGSAALTIEWIYFGGMIGVYIVALFIMFRFFETKWLTQLR